MSLIAKAAARRSSSVLLQHQQRPAVQQAASAVRFHHPSPFDAKSTRGWKAALAVRVVLSRCFNIAVM